MVNYIPQVGAYAGVKKDFKQGDYVKVVNADSDFGAKGRRLLGRIGRISTTTHGNGGAYSNVHFAKDATGVSEAQEVWHYYLEAVDVMAELAETERLKADAEKAVGLQQNTIDDLRDRLRELSDENAGLHKTNAKRGRKIDFLVLEQEKLRDALSAQHRSAPVERESVLLEGFAVGYRKGFADGSGKVQA